MKKREAVLSEAKGRVDPSVGGAERTVLDDVPLYPIRTVAQLAGVDARRIRTWETQYGLLSPSRTKGGHRLFSRRELELIRRIKHMVDEEGLSLQGVRLLLQAEEKSRDGRDGEEE
ncbi:MAG: MerR family transcriptional regulator [Armatimonadota bacterium]|nr:MerR family transcriptional regulator [Armatimonadota bacterium]MDR5703245.1 MerR family transcriptional regulator [Armatimonadota bacterium]